MTTTQTINEFLSLPAESFPGATWVDGDDCVSSPWASLRDYVLPECRQRINHMGEVVRLSADRDGWREGVDIELA